MADCTERDFNRFGRRKPQIFYRCCLLEDVPQRYAACRIVKYSGRTFYINRVDKHQKTDQKQSNSTGTKIYIGRCNKLPRKTT
jgi:hypothetical protein